MSDDQGPSTLKRIVSAIIGGFFDFTGFLGNGRPGFWARSIAFDPNDLDVSLKGKTALLTGGNSGIGKAIATGLARRGAEVWMLCRDMKKGRQAADEVRRATKSDLISPEFCDMASLASIHEFSRRFPVEQVDILIHNAGALVPERTITEEGIEATFATNVIGPFLLTQLLLPKLGASGEAGARVIFVSAHDMYSVKLSLEDLDWSKRPYDAQRAFAMAKRSQVVISEIMDEKLAHMYVHCASMHPGWVDTEGLKRSQPALHKRAAKILRTPEQGADTVIWLAASKRAALPQGLFFCDRTSKTMHLRASTQEDPLERGHLYTTCMKLAGSSDPTPPKPKAEYTVGKKVEQKPARPARSATDSPPPIIPPLPVIDSIPETRKGAEVADAIPETRKGGEAEAKPKAEARIEKPAGLSKFGRGDPAKPAPGKPGLSSFGKPKDD